MEIRVEDLRHVYNPGTPLEVTALDGIDFSVPSGRVLGILGGTGSGKTTLIKHLNGLLLPTTGRVLVGGRETGTWGSELRRRVGIVFQRPERQLFESTVFRDLSFVLRRFSDLEGPEIRQRVERAAAAVGLDLEKIGERSPTALSGGEKRKAAIAGVLVNDPQVLVLDEPAVGLDPPSVADLIRTLKGLGETRERTVVLVSHDMERFLQLLDYLMVMEKGRAAAFGSPAELCSVPAPILSGDPCSPIPGVTTSGFGRDGNPFSQDARRVSVIREHSHPSRSDGGTR